MTPPPARSLQLDRHHHRRHRRHHYQAHPKHGMVEEMCAEAVSVGQEVAVAELEGVLAANNEAFLASIASPPPLLNIGGQTMPCVDGRSLVCAGRLAKFYRCAAPRTPKH